MNALVNTPGNYKPKLTALLQRSYTDLPIAIDLPRLARLIDIKDASGEMLLKLDEDAFAFDYVREILVVLTKMLYPEEDVKQYEKDFVEYFKIGKSVPETRLNNWLKKVGGDESKVIQLLRLCNQAAMAAVIIELKIALGMDNATVDMVNTWRFCVQFGDEHTNQVLVSAVKREQSMKKYFEYEWQLKVIFDVSMNPIKPLEIKVEVIDLVFTKTAPPSSIVDVVKRLGFYLSESLICELSKNKSIPDVRSFVPNVGSSANRRSSSSEIELREKQPGALLEGYLRKVGGKNRKKPGHWQKRYFVLHPASLSYYKKPPKKNIGKVKGVIELSNVVSVTQADSITRKLNSFQVDTPDRTYWFQSMTTDECEAWIASIQKLIDDSYSYSAGGGGAAAAAAATSASTEAVERTDDEGGKHDHTRRTKSSFKLPRTPVSRRRSKTKPAVTSQLNGRRVSNADQTDHSAITAKEVAASPDGSATSLKSTSSRSNKHHRKHKSLRKGQSTSTSGSGSGSGHHSHRHTRQHHTMTAGERSRFTRETGAVSTPHHESAGMLSSTRGLKASKSQNHVAGQESGSTLSTSNSSSCITIASAPTTPAQSTDTRHRESKRSSTSISPRALTFEAEEEDEEAVDSVERASAKECATTPRLPEPTLVAEDGAVGAPNSDLPPKKQRGTKNATKTTKHRKNRSKNPSGTDAILDPPAVGSPTVSETSTAAASESSAATAKSSTAASETSTAAASETSTVVREFTGVTKGGCASDSNSASAQESRDPAPSDEQGAIADDEQTCLKEGTHSQSAAQASAAAAFTPEPEHRAEPEQTEAPTANRSAELDAEACCTVSEADSSDEDSSPEQAVSESCDRVAPAHVDAKANDVESERARSGTLDALSRTTAAARRATVLLHSALSGQRGNATEASAESPQPKSPSRPPEDPASTSDDDSPTRRREETEHVIRIMSEVVRLSEETEAAVKAESARADQLEQELTACRAELHECKSELAALRLVLHEAGGGGADGGEHLLGEQNTSPRNQPERAPPGTPPTAKGLRRLHSVHKQLAMAKYDKVLEGVARQWVELVTGQQFKSPSFVDSLRNGVLLCELANSIRPGSCKRVSKSSEPFKMLDNISSFIGACTDLGCARKNLFAPMDLYNAENVMQVINSLIALGRASLHVSTFNGPFFVKGRIFESRADVE